MSGTQRKPSLESAALRLDAAREALADAVKAERTALDQYRAARAARMAEHKAARTSDRPSRTKGGRR